MSVVAVKKTGRIIAANTLLTIAQIRSSLIEKQRNPFDMDTQCMSRYRHKN